MWTEEGKKKFEEYTGMRDRDCVGVEEGWRKLKRRVEVTLVRVEKEEKKERRGWWDGECRSLKKKTKDELKKWKVKGGLGEAYKEAKKNYRELCKEKMRRERERWERELEGVRSERDVWNSEQRKEKEKES